MASIVGLVTKPRAVCFPYPGQGHINATLKLAVEKTRPFSRVDHSSMVELCVDESDVEALARALRV
ncbi:hypothetical protein CRG98_007377 [Punica granatum]|uniref:Uncharacterized protein n=1 Tax=Punica granatum TaxID=22663 RepID=A0A2I0KV82_PUNGR|nr:hypothetical protein CRG98_007377 [Punica granatum]